LKVFDNKIWLGFLEFMS